MGAWGAYHDPRRRLVGGPGHGALWGPMAEVSGEPRQYGDYRVEGPLGRGGMGTVLRARGPDGRLVALKVLPESSAESPARARFLYEVSCLQRLEHPNVVRVHGAGLVEGRPWVAMDLIDAPTLQELVFHHIRRHRQPPVLRRVLEVFASLANALAALRAAGIMHRDVKPANLMVRGDRDAVLVDFGLARIEDEHLGLTRTGEVVGTLDFIAPEQIRGQGARFESDYYATGLALWFSLAGRLPFHQLSPYLRAARRAQKDVPRIRELRPEVPVEVEELLVELLQRDPRRRLGDPGELALRLRLLALRAPSA